MQTLNRFMYEVLSSTWTMFYFEILFMQTTIFIWIICYFIATTLALLPSSSTNWRGYIFLPYWSDQFLCWCPNSILKMFHEGLYWPNLIDLWNIICSDMTSQWQMIQFWCNFGMRGGRVLSGLWLQVLPSLPSSPVSLFRFLSSPPTPPPPPTSFPLPLCTCCAS